ncbi:GCN5 family acetyltransferase [Paraburkholderia sabiae]|uniref:GNAT family N-acetyltransferase n=1 Tax=Paraburkholderia sabiae TaxID=273251 RepID=UPI001CB4D133|nr:GNAT family N-acetyltransferase [Paraburkholderia sabiae]CAG9207126.1 GCN5 family acetyltransferase [Paraburkholderia sabiae]
MNSSAIELEAAVSAWHEAIDAFCRLQDVGFVESGLQGSKTIYTGVPVAVLNGVIGKRRKPDVEEFRAFAQKFQACELPWSIQTRGEGAESTSIAGLASEYGLTQCTNLPFMTTRLDAVNDLLFEDERVVVRQLSGSDSELYNSTLAAGYEAPEHVFRRLSAPAILGATGMTAFVVECAEVPVATSFGVVRNGHVAVFNVSTVPEYRRRGYARAATQPVLNAGFAAGAHTALLHCTPAGRKVYESMGFAVREEWLVYSRG